MTDDLLLIERDGSAALLTLNRPDKRNALSIGLRIALGVKSRQTIITWEKATEPLPRVVELALLALENFPEHRNVTALATVHRTPMPEHRGRGFDRACRALAFATPVQRG